MARLAANTLANNNNEAFLVIKSPNEFFRAILDQLNEWISFIPSLFDPLAAKCEEVFPPETRAHWAAVAAQWAAVAAVVVALCVFCFCCFPAIIYCFSAIIRLVLVFIWRVLYAVFRGCCYGGRRLIMKAPASYFRVLAGHNKRGFKNVPTEYNSSNFYNNNPMDHRGVGVYNSNNTYLNGSHINTSTVMPRTHPRVNSTAVYSDFEGEQTELSIRQYYECLQSLIGSQAGQTITTQGLQDLARAKRLLQQI